MEAKLELDHVFIFVKGPQCARPLQQAGLVAGLSRSHTGQGTANLVFFFENAYLELIWLEEEPTFVDARRTAISQRGRWWENGACRFGVCWRGQPQGLRSPWSYQPPYFPEGRKIMMDGRSEDTSLPLLFCLPDAQPPADFTPKSLLQKRFAQMTQIQIDAPAQDLSQFPPHPQVAWKSSEEWGLQIWLTNATSEPTPSQQLSELPLRIHHVRASDCEGGRPL